MPSNLEDLSTNGINKLDFEVNPYRTMKINNGILCKCEENNNRRRTMTVPTAVRVQFWET